MTTEVGTLRHRLKDELRHIKAEVQELHAREKWIRFRLELTPKDRETNIPRVPGQAAAEIMEYLLENGTSSPSDIALSLIMSRQRALQGIQQLMQKVERGKYRATVRPAGGA